MMWRIILTLLPSMAMAMPHIHTVRVKTDQIVVVRTALGIATLIETPESVQSAIIGDQSGFKVQFLDHSVTIKPLRLGARTNLYIQTTSRRYDLRLETGSQTSADYIVYLKSREMQAPIHWRAISKSTSSKGLTLKCRRVAQVSSGFFLLDFILYSKTKTKLSPDDVWVNQGKESRVVDSLFLSGLQVDKHHAIMIGLTLKAADLLRGQDITVSIHAGHNSVNVTLPKDILWE